MLNQGGSKRQQYKTEQNMESTCGIGNFLSPNGLFISFSLRPDHDPNRYGIEWRRFQQRVGEEAEVPRDPRRFTLTNSRSLIIKNIDVMDAGQYACLLDGQPQIIYQIDVLFIEKRRLVSCDISSE